MNRAHFALKLRTDRHRTDGTVGIYLYANINGKLAWYSTNKSIEPKYWNERKQEVKSGCPGWSNLNSYIQLYLTKANNYVSQCNMDGTRANKQALDKILRSANHYANSYLVFVEDYINKHSANYAYTTLKGFNTHLHKLKEFRTRIEFDDIDPLFWADYESYLKAKGNKINTIHKQARLLKQFLNKAAEFGIIRENLLRNIKVKKEEGSRKFLTIHEVKKLQDFFNLCDNKDTGKIKVLRYFLFACYTGLRYSDIKQLRFRHILNDATIEIDQMKTGKSLRIPLNQKAKALIGKETIPAGSIFKVFTDQVTNRYLKDIMKEVGIKKRMSFHCARHTYATISLELSGNIAVVSKILGHASIKTTQIYAKVLENEKRKVMEQWDDL